MQKIFKLNYAILFSLLIAFFLPINVNAEFKVVANGKFADTKSFTDNYMCPGTYYVYRTEGPNTGTAAYNDHVRACEGEWFHYNHILESENLAADDDFGPSYNYITWNCFWEIVDGKCQYTDDCPVDDKNHWHLDYGGRGRTNYSKCKICGDSSKGGVGYSEGQISYNSPQYCYASPNKQHSPWGYYLAVNDDPNTKVYEKDGVPFCLWCKVPLYDAYTGRCNRITKQTKNVEWDTVVEYIEPSSKDNSITIDKPTGDKSKLYVVKYGSDPIISVNGISSFETGSIIGYEIYENGKLWESKGDLINQNNTNNIFSHIEYTNTINTLTEVKYVLYTQAGKFTLPTITLVPRFYWMEFDLNDGGKSFHGETSANMVSGGQATMENAPRMGCYTTVMEVPNPTRPGFKFLGWMVSNMQDGTKVYEEIKTHDHVFSTDKNIGNADDYKTKVTAIPKGNQDTEFNKGYLNFKQNNENITFVPAKYKYFLNLRVDIAQTVKFTAIWVDGGDIEIVPPIPPNPPPTLGNIYGEFGITYKNVEDKTNSDTTSVNTNNVSASLALATQSTNYTIVRSDGTEVKQENKTMNESYPNVYSKLYEGLSGSAPYQDFVNYSKYPNYFGTTKNNARYYTEDSSVTKFAKKYPNMYLWITEYRNAINNTAKVLGDSTQKKGETRGWTNKTVKIEATGRDGSNGVNPNQNGGSGILRMRFDSEAWVNSNKEKTDNTGFTITKTFTKSGIYEGTITIEDRGNIQVNVKTADGKHNGWLANSKGNNITTESYGKIKIDKEAPKLFDPTTIDISKITAKYANKGNGKVTLTAAEKATLDSYTKAMQIMYEGYNDVIDVNNGDTHGWSQDNVRVVILADETLKDGKTGKYIMGSGIAAQGYCWNKDPNVASHWQSGDSTRNFEGQDGVTRKIVVSTRIVTKNEKGYVYVRDAVGNVSKINYIVDHIDKSDPLTNPEKKPEYDPDKENDPTPPSPLDPTDPWVENNPKPTPDIPDKDYVFESLDETNEIKYDWVNKDATIIFEAHDFGVNEGVTDGDGDDKFTYGNGDKWGASGIWKMTLYRSNKNFPTVEEKLKNGKIRKRASKTLYGNNTIAQEVTFGNKLTYVEHREGINYYILEIVDKANNLTSVKLTVKIDKTFPGIPFLKTPEDSNKISESNGAYGSMTDLPRIGNELASNFPTGEYWKIKQVDLNEVPYDNVLSFIQDEKNMKCQFEFVIYDQNWTGGLNDSNNNHYAYGSDRSKDSSGIDKITLKLIDADNNASWARYLLYDYSNLTAIGTSTLNYKISTGIKDTIKTTEADVAYFNDVRSGIPYVKIKTDTDINTFRDFPKASALNYEIEIVDRAGNVKTYSNQPGNEIRNFSIKAVMHSAEDKEYGDSIDYTQEHVTDNSTDVVRRLYYYTNRRGVEYKSTYKLSAEEERDKGLTFQRQEISYNGNATSSIVSSIKAKTNVPYYQLGDMGYVEAWTVGYVPKIQFNFALSKKQVADGSELSVASEMVQEIRDNRVPEKYNLGIAGDRSDISFTRFIPVTSGTKINVSYANDTLYNGQQIPFAAHYGVGEHNSFLNKKVNLNNYWLDKGTFIRIPLYYPLDEDGTYKEDGKPNYKAELHTAGFYAWKGNWKDTSSASYVIYDTKADDIHYRVTHQATSLER